MLAHPVTRCLVPLLTLVLAAGCGARTPKLIPVTGTVKIDGKSTEKVLLRFWPADGDLNGIVTRCGVGFTDAQGRFTLYSGDGTEGIEAGEYKVTFTRRVVGGQAVQSSRTAKPEGVNTVETIPAAYLKLETTPETVTVSETSRDFTFEIKSK